MSNFLVSIVGPTAIGKTKLSVELAKHFKTEIISADSRQFYKEMQIGTAAPTPFELTSVKHHFIHHKSIHEDYNVGGFEHDAIKLLNELFKTHKIAIMVGGSGLYVDAVTKGLDEFPDIDPKIRQKLNNQLKAKGIEHLQEKLKKLDLESYNSIELDNPHRVIRALEVCMGSNKPYSSFLSKVKANRNFETISIGLTADRDIIYYRINDRIDLMMKDGLLEEAEALLPHQNLNALNTVGYKELFKYLNEEWSLDFAVSEIKKNTRRFAKRQFTWFRKDESINWFDYKTNIQQIIGKIESITSA